MTVERRPKAELLIGRITNYLALGGMFNPELANHDAVRDLLIDCRDRIIELERQLQIAQAALDGGFL